MYQRFPHGNCPEGFHQSGNECLYFSTAGTCFSWQQTHCTCARYVSRILQRLSSNTDEPYLQPAKGIRALTLNTPEKTKILRAYYQEYKQENFAVHLFTDYNTFEQCHDKNNDGWLPFCKNNIGVNTTCFETASNGEGDICLQEIPCNETILRYACEFTLPGNSCVIITRIMK